MDSWLEQPGYPVLTAVVENDTLKINKNNSSSENMKTKAANGLCHWTATGLVFQIHLKQKRLKSQVMLALATENNEPLRFNTENTAHYITDYQGELLDAIVDNMASLDNLRSNKSFKNVVSWQKVVSSLMQVSCQSSRNWPKKRLIWLYLQYHQSFKDSASLWMKVRK